MNIYQEQISLDPSFPFTITRYTLLQKNNTKESFHWHTCFEITCVKSGTGIYYVNQNQYPVQRGDIVIFNNVEAHGWEVTSNAMHVLVAVFSIDFISERMGDFDYWYLKPFVERGSNFKNLIRSREPFCADITYLLDEIDREYTLKTIGYQFMIKSDVLKILTFLIRHFTDENKSTELLKVKKTIAQRLEKAFIYLHNHYAEKITLDAIAAQCCMSSSYFSSCFRKATGSSFTDYLTGIRIRHTQKLLNTTDLSVTSAAMECGFRNMSNFYRHYRKFTGKTPNEEFTEEHKLHP
ncbi:MAG: AraC family transcriptional regulator [Treponema sp.]|jgi:AraC-like DNA-binding protein/quercetin dioxygenase-like cupin family protein|nr:AraC family transcriptional regulator [Treponema sp.]